ncbi:EAL domain-containing protein [Hahella sp. KA22]|uniref:bifunctional diguanylate cyclase/phosphodiesterase n=1 Tax=Hahella sp. KA22 TaxID=1628392 RepID=UPI000FDE5912|nr:EAL domain-containing protein [Hahella sp. KA22]AZZ91515.1 EAL domain-containing protein [Hahella sp. KA22]QAY54884.1 EAL domain-containing protein [Hahella sp. KA22]
MLKLQLRARIFLFVLPFIVLPLLMFGSLSYLYIRENTMRILEHQLDLSLRSGRDELNKDFSSARANLELFVSNDIVRRYLNLPDTVRYKVMQPALLGLFADYRKAFPSYVDIALLLPDGSIDSRDAEDPKAPPKYHDFIERVAAQRPSYAEQLFFVEEGGYIEYVQAQRIDHRNEAVEYLGTTDLTKGYLLVVMRIEDVMQMLRKKLNNPEGYVVVSDPQGKSYFLNDKELKLWGPLVKQIITSGIGRLRGFTLEDQDYLGGFYRVNEQLFITGIVTEEVVDRMVTPILIALGWFVVIVVIVAFLLVYSKLNKLLLEPINRLQRQIAAFRSGAEIAWVFDGNDELSRLSAEFEEMASTQRGQIERVKGMSNLDPLTGLPNRTAFSGILEKAVSYTRRQDQALAVLFIDIDHFKRVNETYGSKVGDELFRQVADRISASLRLSDEVARQVMTEFGDMDRVLVRTGGDEFTVLLRDIRKAHQVSLVASRILAAFDHPFTLDEHSVSMSVSIGIALYPVDGQSPELLLKSADLAMYEAKQAGGACFRFFTHALNTSAEKRLQLERDIQDGLIVKEFTVHLQPRVNLKTGVATEFEAMARWNHPRLGILLPEQFISVAEESGHLIELGKQLLEAVCSAIKSLQQSVGKDVTVSFNLSPHHLRMNEVLSEISNCLERYGLPGETLELEITEDLLKAENKDALILLNRLRERGVSVALDDFGSGDSSLSALRRAPIDTLKVSPNFMQELYVDKESPVVLKAICDLARSLELKVVVQGVESRAQVEQALTVGADQAQGHYLSEAVPVDDVRVDFRIKIFDLPTGERGGVRV